MKYTADETVASNDPRTIGTVARNTLELVDACLRESGGHFQHFL
jgi:hypothetical protein